MNWNEYKVRKCPSWIPSIKVKSVFCSTFLFFSCPLPPFFPTNSLFLIPHVRCAAITALIAVNWDFFGKQSSLNDLTKFIQVPPRHSLVFDNISPLLIYVGRSHCVFIGWAFGQCQRSYGQVSQATSVSSAFPVFPMRAARFCRLDTEQRLTAVTLESTTTCILQSWTSGTCGSFLCIWYWSRRAVGLDWCRLLDGTDHNMLKAQL